MSLRGDLARVRRLAERQGWRVEKSQHWWLFFWPGFDPRHDKPCQIGTTPHTRGRALPNLLTC